MRVSIVMGICAAILMGCARQSVSYTDISNGKEVSIADTQAGGGEQFSLPVSTLVVTPKVAEATATPNSSDPGGVNQGGGTGNKNNKNNKNNAKPTGGSDAAAQSQLPTAGEIAIGTQNFSVNVVPQESPHEFRVNNNDGFFSTTDVQITRLPNTNIPSAVGVTFTDNTQTIITQGGSIIASVIPLLATVASGPKTDCSTPAPLQSFTLVMPAQSVKGQPLGSSQPCWSYNVTYGPATPPNTMTLATFQSITGSKGNATNVSFFPVPACRDATIELLQIATGDKIQATIKQRVETPDFLYPVPLPEKGSIKMHPVCNADVSDTPTNQTAAYLNDVSALLTAVKSIEAAGRNVPTAK